MTQPQRFRRFERVTVTSDDSRFAEFKGHVGTILWADAHWLETRRTDNTAPAPYDWMYLLFFAECSRYRTFFESDLSTTNMFDPEDAHLAKRPEISFDLIMEDDMDFAEGTYRLPGRFWEVWFFSKTQDVPMLRHRIVTHPSGVRGIVFDVPPATKLDRQFVLDSMKHTLGLDDLQVVHGPDSMILK